jgi:oxygen-independent coproporphyrinogen-3 oxidase
LPYYAVQIFFHKQKECKHTIRRHFEHIIFVTFVTAQAATYYLSLSLYPLAGIYLHIPFCRQACHYCDFHFSTNLKQKGRLTEALALEAKLQQDYLKGETVHTIYFGGGTPSLLSQQEFNYLLETLSNTFSLSTEPEITLEANPDDLSPAKLKELKASGINRLSIGIQSFHEEHLRFMNRAHSAQQALDCVPLAREAGFDSISIDLIYAIPAPDHSIWEKDLQQALNLQPEHISSYCLTIEPQTAFGNWLQKGKIQAIDEEYAATQFEQLLQRLQAAGYEQYEISNFCLPGKYSRHNSSYWQQQAYLGLGPSAHSFNRESRQFNVRNNATYLKALEAQQLAFEQEKLTKANMINEYLLTGLRTKWGCKLPYLKNQWGYDLQQQHGTLLKRLLEQNYAQLQQETLVLTNTGKLLADEIATQLMAEEDL